jgi:hypothetical protein
MPLREDAFSYLLPFQRSRREKGRAKLKIFRTEIAVQAGQGLT